VRRGSKSFADRPFIGGKYSIGRLPGHSTEDDLKIPPIEVVSWHPRVSGDARHKWLREVLVALVGRYESRT
jgi:hypothetical protein